jgi:NADH-quinone oxidoreductase subunit M
MIPLILLIIIPSAFFAAIAVFRRYGRILSTVSALAGLALILFIFGSSLISGSAAVISQSYSYIPSLGIQFTLSVSNISLVLLLMASIILLATSLSGNMGLEKETLSSLLIVLFQIGAYGLFISGNFFIFFIFWDIGVIAPFFMINVLGSANRRIASYKFILYELFSSALLLTAIILVYFYSPGHTLNIYSLAGLYSSMPIYIQETIFSLFFIAFMINMPLFPLHTWLPDAHSEASTQGSMMLSGILTKFGGFGMLLIFITMPIARSFSLYIAALATISAFYAAFLMMRQRDIKRIVAHTTIIEMSIIMFSIATMTAIGYEGALYGMLSHGLVVALMFLAAGGIEHMFHERNIGVLKGLSKYSKTTSYVFLIGIFVMSGLPLTTGFVSDLLIFIGGINAFGIYGIVPLFSLILLAGFMYLVINRSFFANKQPTKPSEHLPQAAKAGYAILLLSIFIFGILPFIVLNLVNSSIL